MLTGTNKQAKVVFLGPLPPPYMGPSLATKIILNSALQDRYNIIHLDTSDHRELTTLGAIDFINVYLALKHYVQLLSLIVKHRPDIVYVPISQTTIGYLRDSGFILLPKLFGIKVICHLRGGNFRNWYSTACNLTKFFVRTIHSLVDCQIVLGECLKNLFEELVAPEKIYVVPNGADYTLPQANRTTGKIRILFLANFIRTKGILDVLSAVPEVIRMHKNVEFIFAGNWRDIKTKNDFDTFKQNHKNLPVTVAGPVHGENKQKLLMSADIFVFPSYYPPEGHPWVIVEAMAAGLPVISTDQGAIKESVIHGENGFIVSKKNPSQIAKRINELIESSDLRQKMGRESKRLYTTKFTEEKMVYCMTQAFDSVL